MHEESSERDHHGRAVDPERDGAPRPGDIVADGDVAITPEPLVGRDADSALAEEAEDSSIPATSLWAMKDVRHTHWHLLPSHDRHEQLRIAVGAGDAEIFAIDDGRTHATLGRLVGRSASGCDYTLVGRIGRADLDEIVEGRRSTTDAFAGADEIALMGVADVGDVRSSNIFTVARFASSEEIPAAYLPGSPRLDLAADLEITAY
jgi:hypothetical protein